MNIKMIADRKVRKDGSLEPDILRGRKFLPLRFTDLDGEVITTVIPSGPWTQASLVQVSEGVELMFGEKIREGADAYLGSMMVGSTEI